MTAPTDADRVRVLYVLGIQRGGTTLAGRLAARLPGAVYAGEVRRLWAKGILGSRTCGCGRDHRACPRWSAVIEAVNREHGAVGEIARLQEEAAPVHHPWRTAWRPTPVERREAYGSVLSTMYRAFAAASGATLVVDVSKSPADAMAVDEADGVESRFVHVIRDPRAVGHSARGHRARRHTDSGPLTESALSVYTGVRWTARHLACRSLVTRLGAQRTLTIRYEDLAADPGAYGDLVADLTGSPRVDLGSRVELPVAHGAAANGRFASPETITVEPDERWRTEAGIVSRATALTLAAPVIARQ